MALTNPRVVRISASDATFTGTVRITGGPNITVGTDASGVSISGANPSAGGGVAVAASNTTYTSGTVSIMAAGGAITVSSNTGQRIDLIVPATSSFSASTNITLSTTGSTIQFSGPRPSPLIADWANFQGQDAIAMTTLYSISKTPFYWSENLPGALTANSVAFKVSFVTTGTLQSFTMHYGVYTFVNSTSLALLGSVSETYVLSTASSASWSGIRNLVMTSPGTHTALSSMSAGGYGFGMMLSGAATGSMNIILFGAGSTGGPLGMFLPGVNQASTVTSQGAQPLFGRGSTTVNALPANVVRSELINQGTGSSAALRPWMFIRS